MIFSFSIDKLHHWCYNKNKHMNKCSYEQENEKGDQKAMKKTYKIDVDCATANKMEVGCKNTAGVKDATVNSYDA